jgi:RNA polymerase sigma factor (sigma-70 family)
MATRQTTTILRIMRKMVVDQTDAHTSDRDLLRRFAEHRDEAAFAVLVRRYGAMVVGVAQRVVRDYHQAEDVCQAAFLLLAQKAGKVTWRESVAQWLYEVAHHLALKARDTDRRRNAREAKAPHREPPDALADITLRDLQTLIDEELSRLPRKYRALLLICCLEGKTRDEAAAYLGLPLTTVKSRLEEGRELLRRRLVRRGLSLSITLAGINLCSGAARGTVREELVVAMSRAALQSLAGELTASVIPPNVAALVKGGLHTMLQTRLKIMAALTLTILIGATTAGALSYQTPARAHEEERTNDRTITARKTAGAEEDKPAVMGTSVVVPETARILVLDARGKPVAGATIRRLRAGRTSTIAETVLGKTDARGRFDAEVVSSCSFTAVVDGPEGGVAWSPAQTRGGDLTLKMAPPLPIKGRLVDLQGKPIAGAKVNVESVEAAVNDDLTGVYNIFRTNPRFPAVSLARLDAGATGAPPGTVTDKDGRFELRRVGRNQLVRLRLEAEGMERRGITIVADPEFATRMKPLTDAEKEKNKLRLQHMPAVYGPAFTHAVQPEHLLVGTVVDGVTGKPVKGITVWGTTVPLHRTSFGHSPWKDTAVATTDDKGQFTLRGLPKAVVWDLPFLPREKKRYLHIRAEGAPYLDDVVIVPDTADYTPAKVEVKLRPAVMVSGQLVNKATLKPVSGTAHWMGLFANKQLADGLDDYSQLYKKNLSGVSPTGTHQETGADGRFQLRVPPGPGVIFARANVSEEFAVYTPARVREEDRNYLVKREKNTGRRTIGAERVDDQESFHMVGSSGGSRWFVRWENDYRVIDPTAGARSVEVKMVFDPGARVKLKVLDPEGKPLKGATLVGHGEYGERTPTFASAEIEVGGLDPKGQPQQLYLLHKGRNLCAGLKVRGDEKDTIRVKMQSGASVVGRVVDHTGKPVQGARVSFQTVLYHPRMLLDQRLLREWLSTSTDANGKFTFPRMFPGHEFDIFVSLPGFGYGTVWPKRIILEAGETKDAGEFKLPDPKKANKKE